MPNFEIARAVVDSCSKEELMNPELLESITNAQHTSNCLNRELGAYGIKTIVSPDQKAVYIDNEGMSQILHFFEGQTAQPVLTKEHVGRVKDIVENAKDKKVDLLWLQTGLKRKYYLFKQYGFHGINMLTLLNVNTINSAGAAVSATGSVALSIPTVIGLSWSGGIFLSTLENVIPDNMVKTKAIVKGSKYLIGFPIRIVETTTNGIIGFIERPIIGDQLPTNVTDDIRLTQGPKIEDLPKLKQPLKKLLGWLSSLLD